jgi:hypothetical protein
VSDVVEIHEIAGANIDRPDAEPGRPGIDQVKIHQAFERRFQRGDIVIADRLQCAVRLKIGWRHARFEKIGGAAQQRAPCARLIGHAVGELAVQLKPLQIRYAERRGGNRFPEFAQSLDALVG